MLWWVLRGLPDDGTCDVPKHVGDLLMSDGHILCMWSWLCKLKSINVPLKILLWYPCKEFGVIVHMIQILTGCGKFVVFHCFNCIGIDAMLLQLAYTECPRRNGQNFGIVFLMLKYTNITQNTYIQNWTVTEIMAREVWNFNSCYTLTDYQIHIKTGRNMWFL